MRVTSKERQLIYDIVESLLKSGLLYGEELKEYVLSASTLGSVKVKIKDYEIIEKEINRMIDKKVNRLQPDEKLEDIKIEVEEGKKEHYLKGKKVYQKPKPILQIDPLTNEVIAKYKSVGKASRETGISKVCICDVARGKQALSKGFKWVYEEYMEV